MDAGDEGPHDALMADARSTDEAAGATLGPETGDDVVDDLLAALAGFASRAAGAGVPEEAAEASATSVATPRHTIEDIRKCAPPALRHHAI